MDARLSRETIIAGDRAWRTASIPRRASPNHAGAGVYYGAARQRRRHSRVRRVLVVGGGNSAGQGALYLARYASDVQIVIRRDSLHDTMSHYLIEQIEKTPNIRLRPRTELERVDGDGHVERVTLASVDDGTSSSRGGRRGLRVHRHEAEERVAALVRPARSEGVRAHRA